MPSITPLFLGTNLHVIAEPAVHVLRQLLRITRSVTDRQDSFIPTVLDLCDLKLVTRHLVTLSTCVHAVLDDDSDAVRHFRSCRKYFVAITIYRAPIASESVFHSASCLTSRWIGVLFITLE